MGAFKTIDESLAAYIISQNVKRRNRKECEIFMEHLARMRTLAAAYKMLKEEDPNTAISMNYLRKIVMTGQIPVHKVGTKRLLNYDALLLFLENPPESNLDAPYQHGVIRPLK